MKTILALAAAPLILASTLPAEAAAKPSSEQGRCWNARNGERYCRVTSTIKMPVQRSRARPYSSRPSGPRSAVVLPEDRSGYRSPRQVCRYEDHNRYAGYSGYYRGYRGYNVEPRIIDVDNELRKRDMPICLAGQYPYSR